MYIHIYICYPCDFADFLCRTRRGSSSNGQGLGFGFAWLPSAVAQHLVQLGRLTYTEDADFATVRESRGAVPPPPAAAVEGEKIAVAVGASFVAEEFWADFLLLSAGFN